MHEQAQAFFATNLAGLPPLRVVEFGSLNVNGSLRDIYEAQSWFGIDLRHGKGVDLVADAATWRTSELFDLVLCAEVFEHTPDWEAILDTAWFALAHGGLFLASCATGNRPPHSVGGGTLDPFEFYRNVPADEMSEALARWADVSVTVADGHFGADDLYVCARRT